MTILKILEVQSSAADGMLDKAIQINSSVIMLQEDSPPSARTVYEIACGIEELIEERDRYKKLAEECGNWDCCGLLVGSYPLKPDAKQCWEVNIGTDAWCPICLAHAMLYPDREPGKAAARQGGIPDEYKQKTSTK